MLVPVAVAVALLVVIVVVVEFRQSEGVSDLGWWCPDVGVGAGGGGETKRQPTMYVDYVGSQ